MININFFNNGFIVKDHANFKDENDIVCAGVSAIIFGAINSFDKKTIIKLNIDDNVPIIEFFVEMNERNKILLEMVYIQLKTIYDSYKNNINLIFNENQNK